MKKKVKQPMHTFSNSKTPIRVLYKKVGQPPKIKIINDVQRLKKYIVKNNLDIIPYRTTYIICHNKKSMEYMRPNIYLPLKKIAGDFIVANINKNKHDIKSLSQEEIIFYTKDLVNKEPVYTPKKIHLQKPTNITDIYERGYEDIRNTNSTNFEKTLIDLLINLELVLAKILENNGGSKNE